jgi:hypothetical protein
LEIANSSTEWVVAAKEKIEEEERTAEEELVKIEKAGLKAGEGHWHQH